MAIVPSKKLTDSLNLVSALGLPDAILYQPAKIQVSSISAGEFILLPKLDLPKLPIPSDSMLQKLKKLASKSHIVQIEPEGDDTHIHFYVAKDKDAQKDLTELIKANAEQGIHILPEEAIRLCRKMTSIKLQPIIAIAMHEVTPEDLKAIENLEPKVKVPQLVLQLLDTDAELSVKDGKLVITAEDASKVATFDFYLEELGQLSQEELEVLNGGGLPHTTVKLLVGINGEVTLAIDKEKKDKLSFIIDTDTYKVYFSQEKVVVSEAEEFSFHF